MEGRRGPELACLEGLRILKVGVHAVTRISGLVVGNLQVQSLPFPFLKFLLQSLKEILKEKRKRRGQAPLQEQEGNQGLCRT